MFYEHGSDTVDDSAAVACLLCNCQVVSTSLHPVNSKSRIACILINNILSVYNFAIGGNTKNRREAVHPKWCTAFSLISYTTHFLRSMFTHLFQCQIIYFICHCVWKRINKCNISRYFIWF